MAKKTQNSSSTIQFVLMNLAVAVLLTAVLIFGLVQGLKHYTTHGVEVQVPELVGLYTEVADPLLQQSDLHLVVIDSTYSNKVALGTIVEQIPPALSHVKPGRAIYVIINARTRKTTPLPDLRDVSMRQALSTLHSLGIVVSDTLYEPSEYKDLVLDVRRAGETVEPGTRLEEGTRVALVVGYGKGTEEVAVPSLLGLSLHEARALLLSEMLTLGAVEYDETPTDETIALYRVYDQQPGADSPLLQGSRVDIRLSQNPQKAVQSLQRQNENADEDFF